MCPTVQLLFGCLSALWWRFIHGPKHVTMKRYGMWTAVVAGSCKSLTYVSSSLLDVRLKNNLWCFDLESYRGQFGNVFVILVVTGTCECSNEPSGFHKMREISWLAENRLASQERLYSIESVSKYCYYYSYYYCCCCYPPRQIFLGWSNRGG